MKKITKIIGIALIFGLILVGFTGATSASDSVSIKTINISSDLSTDTSYGIANTCNLTIADSSGNTITPSESPTITWNGAIATITVTLPTLSDDNTYTSDSNKTITATGSKSDGTKTASVSDTTLTVTVEYPTNIGNISVSITNPQSGYVPSPTVTIDSGNQSQITATASWGNTAVFLPGTNYTATVTITAKSGYRFPTTLGEIKVNNNVVQGTRNSASEITVTVPYSALTGKAQISSVEITDVTLPLAGVSASSSVSGTAKMKTTGNYECYNSTITGTWKTSSGGSVSKFEKGSTYTLSFEVQTPDNEKYEFTNNATAKINAESAENTLDSTTKKLTISKDYTIDNKIKQIDITIPEPSTGGTLGTATVKGNTSLDIGTGTVTWYEGSSTTAMSSGSTFKANTVYKAVITVPAAPSGYAYDSPKIKVNSGTELGTTSTSGKYYEEKSNTYTVTYTFDKTGKTKISTINITNIDDPVVGNKPDTSASATGYPSGSTTSGITLSPTVKWYLSTTEQTSVFDAEKEYRVEITIPQTSDSEFTSSPTVKLNGTTLNLSDVNVATDGSNITIKHTYDKTNGTINSVKVTFTEPALDKSMETKATISSMNPSNSVSSATIAWTPSGSKFSGGNEYTATVTIKAKSGYTFSDSTSVSLNSVSCKSSEVELSNDKTTLYATHTYSKLATPIDSVTITMDKPVVGKKASTEPISIKSSPSSELEGTISWNPAIPESGEFDEETEYTATITITNKDSDYAFTSSTTAKIKDEDNDVKTSVSSATSMKITYTFEETNKRGLLNLDIGDDEATVPYPKDFFSEIIAIFKALFDIGNWIIFG